MYKEEYLPLEGKVAHQIHLKKFIYNEFDETDEVLYNLGLAQHEGETDSPDCGGISNPHRTPPQSRLYVRTIISA